MTELLVRPLTRDVGELAEKMADVLVSAVDVLEVTAALEAEGIGDRAARLYGYDDVFLLAESLYTGSVRRPMRVKLPGNPWTDGTGVLKAAGRYTLRGLLFGLPGAGYVAVHGLLGTKSAGLVLTLSLVLCWPVGQGIAALAYSRLELNETKRVLRLGLLYGLPFMIAVSAGIGVWLGAHPAIVAVACAQSFYLLSASAALVTGGEVVLLLALLPGVAVTFAGLPGQLLLCGWGLTGLCVLVIAVDKTRVPKAHRTATGGISWIAVWTITPNALFGLVAGGLLTFTIVSAYGGYGAPPEATSAAMVALSASMGPAEWVLYAFRARGHDLTIASRSLREFGCRTRLALLDLILRFMAVLAVLISAALVVAGLAAGAFGVFVCYLLLGGALVIALMLQSFGRNAVSLGLCAATLALEVVVLVVAEPEPSTVQLTGAVTLFTVLLVHTVTVLGRATAHR
ncbi:hypothetical protein GCM10027589_41280 [Actinocorallia lasiicapitis]